MPHSDGVLFIRVVLLTGLYELRSRVLFIHYYHSLIGANRFRKSITWRTSYHVLHFMYQHPNTSFFRPLQVHMIDDLISQTPLTHIIYNTWENTPILFLRNLPWRIPDPAHPALEFEKILSENHLNKPHFSIQTHQENRLGLRRT